MAILDKLFTDSRYYVIAISIMSFIAIQVYELKSNSDVNKEVNVRQDEGIKQVTDLINVIDMRHMQMFEKLWNKIDKIEAELNNRQSLFIPDRINAIYVIPYSETDNNPPKPLLFKPNKYAIVTKKNRLWI